MLHKSQHTASTAKTLTNSGHTLVQWLEMELLVQPSASPLTQSPHAPKSRKHQTQNYPDLAAPGQQEPQGSLIQEMGVGHFSSPVSFSKLMILQKWEILEAAWMNQDYGKYLVSYQTLEGLQQVVEVQVDQTLEGQQQVLEVQVVEMVDISF